MIKTKKILASALICFFLFSQSIFAATAFEKLGRGGANLFLGWLDIVGQVMRLKFVEKKEEMSVFAGVPQGLYYFAGRLVTGVYEIVTFPFPMGNNYEPIFLPETVFDGMRAADQHRWPYPRWGFVFLDRKPQPEKPMIPPIEEEPKIPGLQPSPIVEDQLHL